MGSPLSEERKEKIRKGVQAYHKCAKDCQCGKKNQPKVKKAIAKKKDKPEIQKAKVVKTKDKTLSLKPVSAIKKSVKESKALVKDNSKKTPEKKAPKNKKDDSKIVNPDDGTDKLYKVYENVDISKLKLPYDFVKELDEFEDLKSRNLRSNLPKTLLYSLRYFLTYARVYILSNAVKNMSTNQKKQWDIMRNFYNLKTLKKRPSSTKSSLKTQQKVIAYNIPRGSKPREVGDVPKIYLDLIDQLKANIKKLETFNPQEAIDKVKI